MRGIKYMKTILKLYYIFFKMGAVCFGGGYALLPIIQREIVEKYGFATDEEVADYFAIGQCTPGVIAANVATFVGSKQKGVIGGIAATLGFITPSIIIISLIAAFLTNFAEIEAINHAFGAIRVCVCVLILNAVISFWKKGVVDKLTLFLCIAVFIIAIATNLSPVWLVIACGVVGAISKGIGGVSK